MSRYSTTTINDHALVVTASGALDTECMRGRHRTGSTAGCCRGGGSAPARGPSREGPVNADGGSHELRSVHRGDGVLGLLQLLVLDEAVALGRRSRRGEAVVAWVCGGGTASQQSPPATQRVRAGAGTLTNPVRRSRLRCRFLMSPKSQNLSWMSSSCVSSCSPEMKTSHPSTAEHRQGRGRRVAEVRARVAARQRGLFAAEGLWRIASRVCVR